MVPNRATHHIYLKSNEFRISSHLKGNINSIFENIFKFCLVTFMPSCHGIGRFDDSIALLILVASSVILSLLLRFRDRVTLSREQVQIFCVLQ